VAGNFDLEDIIIRNGLIVTMDKKRRYISDGTVVISDRRIVDVGKTSDLAGKYRADKVIDAKNHLVTPGLFNNHCHNSFYLTRGLFDDGGLMSAWATKGWSGFSYPFEGTMTKADAKAGALASFVEQIKSGVTCFADIGAYHNHMDGVAEAMREIGMRGSITRSSRDKTDPTSPVPDDMLESTKQTVSKTEKLYRDWNGKENDLIRVWFAIRFHQNCSDELLLKQKELADKYHVGMNAHGDGSLRPDGTGNVQRFHKLGILGENLMISHIGHVTGPEIRLLKASNTKICHCPQASAKALLQNIKPGKFIEMVKAGLTISIGVDSVNEGNSTDMLRVAYFSALAHMECFPKTTNITAHRLMEFLTINGAKALLWDDELGSIEKGKTADISIYSMKSMEWHPHVDPVAALIYAANGSSTSTVIINGKPVMENRKMVNVDEEEVARNADRAAKGIWGRLGIKIPELSW
jgi:5-methylthioadenosine/S-adenosylhomocysteine deaminase